MFNIDTRAKMISDLEHTISAYNTFPKKIYGILPSFSKKTSDVEGTKRLSDFIHSMATLLSLSPKAGNTTEEIKQKGQTLARMGLLSSEEDRALLERVRLTVLLRQHPEELKEVHEKLHIYFKTKLNKTLLEKWKKEGFAEEAFFFNPTVPHFLFKAQLHHKVKQFGDSFQYDSETHELKMLVNGEYQNVAEIAERISIKETPRLGSAVISLVSKERESEKWQYLPQKGLTVWDDEGWKKLKPCATLSPSQVTFAQDSARRKDGAQGQKEDFVVEIVSTIQQYKEFPGISGYQDTFKKYKHPWIRIITPSGEFYSVGFNMGQGFDPKQPAALVSGVFKTPDSWETMPFLKRPVTGFAVSKETCEALIGEIESYQNGKTKFSIIEKNCTAFIQRVRDIIDPETAKDKLSFAADVTEVFKMCLPKTIQKIGKKLSPAWDAVSYWGGEFCPGIVKKVGRAVASLFQLIAERAVLTFSGRWFSYGKDGGAFPQRSSRHKDVPWYKFVTHINIALEDVLVRIYLPKKVVEWQLSLPQTRVEEKSVSLMGQYGP